MNKLREVRPARFPLRLRLTLWYLLTLTLIFLLFTALLYWQVQRRLVTQIDTALQLAATQALAGVASENGRLVFQDNQVTVRISRRLSDHAVIYLLGPDGVLWDWLGEPEEFSLQPPLPGLATMDNGGDRWRVYTEAVTTPGGAAGWLQVAQEMDPIEDTLAGFLTQIILGLPFALLLAGVGGFFSGMAGLVP